MFCMTFCGPALYAARTSSRFPVEKLVQELQVSRSCPDVLVRIKRIAHLHLSSGVRHNLHQTPGAFFGDRRRVPVRFGQHHRFDQAIVEPVRL